MNIQEKQNHDNHLYFPDLNNAFDKTDYSMHDLIPFSYFNIIYENEVMHKNVLLNDEDGPFKENQSVGINNEFIESKEKSFAIPNNIYYRKSCSLEENEDISIKNNEEKDNSSGQNFDCENPLIEKKEKENQELEEKNLINNNKKNDFDFAAKKAIFNVFNLFNPRGAVKSQEINKKLKNIRDEINEVIYNNQKKLINDKFKKTNEKLIKKSRKGKPDDLRKKIKARFLKALRIAINEKLKKANSEKEFDFLPQCFVCSITKQRNDKNILNMSFKELMSTDFFTKYKINENKNEKMLKRKRGLTCPDRNKYKKNVEVIKYLEGNKKISEKANYNAISKMKFSEIFDEYLKSKEFEEDIWKLKYEIKEDQEYINDYIIKANNFINHFSKSGKK